MVSFAVVIEENGIIYENCEGIRLMFFNGSCSCVDTNKSKWNAKDLINFQISIPPPQVEFKQFHANSM